MAASVKGCSNGLYADSQGWERNRGGPQEATALGRNTGGLDQEKRMEVPRGSDLAVCCVVRAGLAGMGRIWSKEC